MDDANTWALTGMMVGAIIAFVGIWLGAKISRRP
jgi:hypothetical protein